MKTFRQFLEEAETRVYHKGKEELFKAHPEGKLPEGHRPGYRAGKGWFASSIADEKEAKKRREQRKKPLKHEHFYNYAKRNLIKNPNEFADIASDREEHEIKRKEGVRDRRKKKFGVPYHLDHLQPLSQEQRKKEHRQRRYAIAPGHTAKNLEVKSAKSNIEKGAEPPKRGERGSNFTRSGSIKHTADNTHKFIKRLDSLVSSVRHSPAERMASAYDKITGLPPEKSKPKKETPRRRVPPPRKIASRDVPPPRKISSRDVPPPIRK
jgi:hypothetical protein